MECTNCSTNQEARNQHGVNKAWLKINPTWKIPLIIHIPNLWLLHWGICHEMGRNCTEERMEGWMDERTSPFVCTPQIQQNARSFMMNYPIKGINISWHYKQEIPQRGKIWDKDILTSDLTNKMPILHLLFWFHNHFPVPVPNLN